MYIQAKQYAEGNNVGSPAICDFCGALSQKKAHKGIFIITSDFSGEAHKACLEMGRKISLINCRQLSRLFLCGLAIIKSGIYVKYLDCIVNQNACMHRQFSRISHHRKARWILFVYLHRSFLNV
ncbi:MAG: restriction endonuclease [Vibrio hibernica]